MPEPSSNRVKGWIWAAINPLLEALERVEERLLVRGNLTFRFGSEKLEYLYPLGEYLDRGGRLILDDLLGENPELRQAIDQYGEALRSAEDGARALYKAILKARDFNVELAEVRDEYELAYPGARVETEAAEPKKLVAQYIVNNFDRQDIASTAPFWDEPFMQHLRRFRELPEGKELSTRVAFLRDKARAVREQLEALRQHLVREHDVAPAPFEGGWT